MLRMFIIREGDETFRTHFEQNQVSIVVPLNDAQRIEEKE